MTSVFTQGLIDSPCKVRNPHHLIKQHKKHKTLSCSLVHHNGVSVILRRLVGKKDKNGLINDAHIKKGPHILQERRYPLPPHGLLFLISSKCYFICTENIALTTTFLYQSSNTGLNEKYHNAYTIRDRYDDPSHHERSLLNGGTCSSNCILIVHGVVDLAYIFIESGCRSWSSTLKERKVLFNDALKTF